MHSAPTPSDVRVAYREGLAPRERAVLWSWTGFTTTFGAVRAITYTIRRGGGPFRDVSVGGMHLHHYLWGIGLLAGVGAVAVRGTDETRRHPLVGLAYGTGIALIASHGFDAPAAGPLASPPCRRPRSSYLPGASTPERALGRRRATLVPPSGGRGFFHVRIP